MKKVSLTIELKDQISQALAKIRSGVKSVTEEAGKATGAVKSLTGAFGKLDPVKLESTIGILRDLTGEIAAASGVAFTFSQSIADLSAITGIAGAELEGLEANARRIGKEGGLGAAEAARAYTNLASQIDVAKIGIEGLETLQRESITLAQASGMGVAAASDALAGTINQFGLEAGEAARVVNVLAAGSKYGAAEIDDLAASFKAAGSTASVLGVDVEQTAAALEILAQANLKGAESGTALRNVLLFMNTRLGIDFAATSLSDALAALQPRIEDTRYMVKLFGRENIAAAQYLIKNAQAVGEMTEQLTGTDTAAEQAAIRTKSTAHQMEVLRAKVDDLKITLTGALGSAAPAAALISENATSLAVAYMAVSKFSKGVKAATAAIRGMNAAMRANVIGIIVTAVAALAGGLYYLANRGREAAAATSAAAAAAKDLADISASAARAVAGEASRLEMLNAIVHDNTKGIETRRKAIAEIQKTVPDYHASLDKEGRLLRDNAAAIGKYVEGLKNAAKLQAVKDKLGEIGAQRVDIEMARDAQNRAKAIRRRRAEESVSNAKVYQNGEEQEIKPEVRAAMRGMVTAIADGGKSYNQALDAAIASLQPDGRVTEAAKQLRTAMSGFSTYKPENEGDALWTSTPSASWKR